MKLVVVMIDDFENGIKNGYGLCLVMVLIWLMILMQESNIPPGRNQGPEMTGVFGLDFKHAGIIGDDIIIRQGQNLVFSCRKQNYTSFFVFTTKINGEFGAGNPADEHYAH